MISQTDIDDFRDDPVKEDEARTTPHRTWIEWMAYACWAYGYGLAGEAMLNACFPVEASDGERSEH